MPKGMGTTSKSEDKESVQKDAEVQTERDDVPGLNRMEAEDETTMDPREVDLILMGVEGKFQGQRMCLTVDSGALESVCGRMDASEVASSRARCNRRARTRTWLDMPSCSTSARGTSDSRQTDDCAR